MRHKYFRSFALVTAAYLASFAVALQAQSNPGIPSISPVDQKSSTATHKAVASHSEGERIFNQNCSRCHTAPEGFPPSISGTVVRHMRVRASLSKHDEQELLRFFNP